MPAPNMVNLGYVIAIGLIGWVAGVHAVRLVRKRRGVRLNGVQAEGAPAVGYN